MKKMLMGLVALGLVAAFCGLSAAEDAQEIKGDAGCARCCFKGEACAAAVKVGDIVYALQASDTASDKTKELIASFKGAAKSTPVVIKGVVKDNAIIADSVAKVEAKKEESGGCN